MSVSYLNSSTASLSPDLCSLAYFELFYVIFVLFCYNFHKISFSFPTISSLSVTPRTLVTSNSQNGIPVRIVQRTFKTRRFPDPICWGSSCRDGLKLQNLCFPDVSLWFWCRGSLEKFCWSEFVKMAWKGSLPYWRHGYVDFPTLENIERLWFWTLQR